ncbi:hypothetical protein STEG23_004396, partial [Scotinomys teguina]
MTMSTLLKETLIAVAYLPFRDSVRYGRDLANIQAYTLVSNWGFLLLLTSKMSTPLLMNYCDPHTQESYHVCPMQSRAHSEKLTKFTKHLKMLK